MQVTMRGAKHISSGLAAVLTVLTVSTWAVPASAAETMYENDPARQTKESIEEIYGVYILNPSRRRPEEKVEIKNDIAELWLYVDPRKPDFNRVKCDGLKWVLIGRFGKGGAQPFFNEFDKLNNVDLNIFQLNSARTVDKDGKYTVTKTPSVIMKARVTRKKSEAMDWAAVKTALDKNEKTDKELEACVRAGEKFLDKKVFYSKEYFK